MLATIVSCFVGLVIANVLIARFAQGRAAQPIPPSVLAAASGVRDSGRLIDMLADMQSDGVLTEEQFLRQKAWILSKELNSDGAAADSRAVVVTGALPNKIQSIKVIRKVCPEHGLAASKYIVDHLPQVIRSQIGGEQAESLKGELEMSGLSARVV